MLKEPMFVVRIMIYCMAYSIFCAYSTPSHRPILYRVHICEFTHGFTKEYYTCHSKKFDAYVDFLLLNNDIPLCSELLRCACAAQSQQVRVFL